MQTESEYGQRATREAEADALLKDIASDPAAPCYTEAQLQRRGRRHGMCDIEPFTGWLAGTAGESPLEALQFLMECARLEPLERFCLRGWLYGHTQAEIAWALWESAHPGQQQRISRCLRRALRKCVLEGVSFAQFSRHALYRRPVRHDAARRLLLCPHCHELFAFGLGQGRYCSSGCREAWQRRGL